MSCNNPNCNAGCGCNNCCPPVTPPTPPVPPTCIGTQCEELYDGACVEYTGPAITCLNIIPNTSLNTVIQTIASNICNYCNKSQCISPFKLFFERLKTLWVYAYSADPTITFYDIFESFINNGIIIKKCQYCCPDPFLYTLAIGTGSSVYADSVYNDVVGIPNYEIPCENCWTGYSTAASELLASFDPTFGGTHLPGITVADIHEFGGFNNVSGIKDLNVIFENLFTTSQITDIMKLMYTQQFPLSVTCDTETGNIIIGSLNSVRPYMQTVMGFPS